MARDYSAYLTWDTDQLLQRLAGVTAVLADLAELEAEARAQELGAKAEAFRSSSVDGPTARRQVMAVEATPASQALLETRGQIEALGHEKTLLLTLIDVRLRVPVTV